MTSATGFFDMAAAPMRIGMVRLRVRDLDTVSSFYQSVLGLSPIETAGGRAVLGTASTALLELAGDASLAALDPRQAGLFHTAFLLASRADLARWLVHAREARIHLQGASDHIVSEALYLADPEGNGIEVYCDRPEDKWRTASGAVEMPSDPLHLQDLLDAARDDSWRGFPEDGCIGHVHLRVGDTEAADRFYRDVIGLDLSARYPGASFYGSGGYHHQLAGNVWTSRGAGRRPDNMAGLYAVEVVLRDSKHLEAVAARVEASGIAADRSNGALVLRDPWGTRIEIR